MKVLFGSTYLAVGDVESAGGVSLNGQQINDEAQFYRALTATFFARGARSASLSFFVTRRFNSLREAQRFMFEHFAALPRQDDLQFYIGTDADGEWVTFSDAVIDTCGAVPTGATVQVQYGFRVTTPTIDTPSPTVTEPDTDMVKRATINLTAGDTGGTVTFSTPFGATPVIGSPHVLIPAGGDKIWAHVVASSVSTSGFDFELTAAIPGAGYKLSWEAFA